MRIRWLVLMPLLVAAVTADNVTSSEACEPRGLWGDLLEEWAVSADQPSARHGRVMALPPTKGYYVTERIDGPLMPPPPPPHSHGPHPGPYSGPHPSSGPHLHTGPHSGPHSGPHAGPHTSQHAQHPPPQQLSYSQYDEWQATPPPPPGAGKIVNRPPNPYKDKFKPSYPGPSQNQPIPVQQAPPQQWGGSSGSGAAGAGGGAADRVDTPPAQAPHKQVSETDLYLLSAIEKLVYRADLMEKRLRRIEETLHYLVAGKDTKPEPCASNFTRVGSGCYYVSPEAGDWKAASLRCRKMRTHLLEVDSDDEKRTIYSALLGDKRLKGADFWTGGLNPGLLWIWSHSARPVANNSTISGSNSTSSATIVGEGRCLALVHDPAVASYVYRGQDCSLRHRFICELPEDKAKLSNEIERVARELRQFGGEVAAGARRAKIAWSDRIKLEDY